MTYKAYDVLVLVMVLIVGIFLTLMGFWLATPGFGEAIWWLVMGLGVWMLLVGLISIGFTATQPTEVPPLW